MSELSFELTADELARSRVVVVDDDDLVIGSLRNFLLLEMDIEAAVFTDPKAALGHVRDEPIDLIVSDFLMPGMNGIELLAEVRSLQPQAPRILLTGYADKENAIRGINRVQLFQYIEKPWDNDQFQNVVRNGLERHHLMRQLARYLDELGTTQRDLAKLKKGLMRAFA